MLRRPNRRRYAALAALPIAAVLALSACTGTSAVDQNASSNFVFKSGTQLGQVYPVADRKPANDFTGQMLDGAKTFRLAATRGHVTVINFWAAWCSPCRTETPQFDLLYRKLKSSGVDFVGIDTKDVRSNAQAFVSSYHITYPIVYDEQGATALKLGDLPATSLPFTVLIDKQGRVAGVYVIRLSTLDLQHSIDKLT